jgi:HTH-type transcriptional regulator, osmoprotectant uptake regulator
MHKLDREFMGFMKDVHAGMGFDENIADILALIYIEPEVMSLEEVAHKAGCSIASVSMKTKLMEEMGILLRFRKPGSKKVYYRMEKNIARLVRTRLVAVHTRKILPSKRYIPRLLARYRKLPQRDQVRKRIAILIDYTRQIGRVEKALALAISSLKEDK